MPAIFRMMRRKKTTKKLYRMRVIFPGIIKMKYAMKTTVI